VRPRTTRARRQPPRCPRGAGGPAYRQYHSTETVITKVYNDMLMAADSGQVSALCLLYPSAAFNTVDHDLLMRRLERQ